MSRPYLLFETVLGSIDRLAVTLGTGRAVWLLAAILLVVSIAAPVPYGLLCPSRSFWKITALFVGSLGICFPCLHAFSQFLGFRLDLGRTVALALVISGAAGLFAFAFAPIIWFLDFSINAEDCSKVTPRGLSVFILSASLLLGVIQMSRCLAHRNGCARENPWMPLLIVLWLPLLIFITYRMARLLEIV